MTCPDCYHPYHGTGDPRCSVIVGGTSGPMPTPEYCECLRYEDVLSLIGAANRRADAADERARMAERRSNDCTLVVVAMVRASGGHIEVGDDQLVSVEPGRLYVSVSPLRDVTTYIYREDADS